MHTDCISHRSDVVVTRSKGLQVPSEVWLEILSGPHEYYMYPRIMRVCKGIQSILKVGEIETVGRKVWEANAVTDASLRWTSLPIPSLRDSSPERRQDRGSSHVGTDL